MEWFTYLCIIFCMSMCETDHDNVKGGGGDLEGDWIKVLFVTSKRIDPISSRPVGQSSNW